MTVDRARGGTDGEFEDFHQAYVERVHRALALSLGNDDLAREATDEAMLRAYARWALTVHETATGAVRVSRVLGQPASSLVNVKSGFGGLAWLDDHQVLLARLVPPDEDNRLYQLDEMIRLDTVRVER